MASFDKDKEPGELTLCETLCLVFLVWPSGESITCNIKLSPKTFIHVWKPQWNSRIGGCGWGLHVTDCWELDNCSLRKKTHYFYCQLRCTICDTRADSWELRWIFHWQLRHRQTFNWRVLIKHERPCFTTFSNGKRQLKTPHPVENFRHRKSRCL